MNTYVCWISKPRFSVLASRVGICGFLRCFCRLLQNRWKRQKKAIGRLMTIGINCRERLWPINQYPVLKEHWGEEKLQWTVQIRVNLQFYIKTLWELFIIIILCSRKRSICTVGFSVEVLSPESWKQASNSCPLKKRKTRILFSWSVQKY